MHYNPKAKFTQVDFIRTKEGVYVHKSQPLYIDAEKIDSFGDGRIDLDSGGSIFVEQDSEEILRILEEKLKELAAVEAADREQDRTGMDGQGTESDG